MPSPLLVLLAPLILATIVFLFRRWPKVAGLSGALFLFILALILARVDLDLSGQAVTGGLIRGNSWMLLGREIALTAAIRTILLFAYGVLIIIFLLAALLPQGTVFIPLAFAVLSPLAGALMVRPLVFGAVLLLIAAGLLALLIQGERAGSTLASFRYLTMVVIAAPLLLIAGWILGTEQAPLMGSVATLYVAAFVILLAGFPFQIWVAPVVSESQPLVPAVIFGVAQMMIIAFCLLLLLGSPDVQRSAQFWQVIRVSGTIALILAGLFSLTARSLGRLLGYLILIDIGIVVLAFSFLDRTRPELIMTLLIARVIGLVLTGMGFGYIRYQLGPGYSTLDMGTAVRRLAWIAPVGLVLFVFGGLSLVGMPLTAGFRGHWMTVDLASTQSFWLAAVIVLSMAAGVVTLLRLLSNSLRQDSPVSEAHKELTKEMKWAAGLALAAAIFLAVFPQPIVDLAQRMIQLF
ncbi:MAG: proton-conducting transporter membrane subunit [Candidatus Promineifilaceae bacterium]